ncbi:MAG: UPF0104 family protein, partial [Cylindrospermopsis raciborskii PAMP2012]
ATMVTLLAHTWAGLVWTWILNHLNQSVPNGLFIRVYLKTNIAKYLPGNVWHYYGRILAAKDANIPTFKATLSVLLEPLLMATAALINIILLPNHLSVSFNQTVKFISLFLLLLSLHPVVLNPLIRLLFKVKSQIKSEDDIPNSINSMNNLTLEKYPLLPLVGELIFVCLRGTGFILTIFALGDVNLNQIPILIGAFSLAWVLGLVIPGAPGGLGVFESTAILLLQNTFPPSLLIGAIALYRLMSISAETIGAGLAYIP